jgi:Ca-activated chloride channel family protein
MQADFVLDYDVLTVQQPQKLYLVARLTAGPAPEEQARRPLNLSVVIDRSGSMAGDKLDFTRQAAQFLVQNLNAHDTLSIVLYNDRVKTLLLPERVLHKDAISQKIDTIKASGTTNMSGGWLEGVNHVSHNLDPKSVNRVILMTDGLANRGVVEPERLMQIAEQKLGSGVSTTTMGLGTDFNEDLLIDIANSGGGAFYFIESPEVTPLIFQEELSGLLRVIGQNLVISVETNAHINAVSQLNAYPSHQNGDRVSFRLGDVFGEEVKTLALEITLNAFPSSGEQIITTLRFDYDELTENGVEHRVMEMPVRVNIAQPGLEPQVPNPEANQPVLLLKAANARRNAIEKADQGNYTMASQVLREVASAINDSQIIDNALLEERDELLKQAEEMDRGAVAYDEHSRKIMSTQAIYTMTDRHASTQAMRLREVERILRDNQSETPRKRREIGPNPTHVVWNEEVFPLEQDLIRIGRASQNEIVLKASGVSRFHCQIKRIDGKLVLEDLNSTNGTLLDGRLLTKPHILSTGDEIYVCNEKLYFYRD